MSCASWQPPGASILYLLLLSGIPCPLGPTLHAADEVGPATPRLLINREKAGEADPALRAGGYAKGFDFHPKTNYRDALYLGDCDSGVAELARLLGWEEELAALVAAGAAATAAASAAAATPEGVAAAAAAAGAEAPAAAGEPAADGAAEVRAP